MSHYAGLSLREIYTRQCEVVKCKRNSGVCAALPNLPHQSSLFITLDLSSNFVGPRGVLPVVEVIRCAPALQRVKLAAQRLDNAAVETLCHVLQTHPTVYHLDVSDNPLTDVAGGALLMLAQMNRRVTNIDVYGTLIQPVVEAQIALQLAENQAEQSAVKEETQWLGGASQRDDAVQHTAGRARSAAAPLDSTSAASVCAVDRSSTSVKVVEATLTDALSAIPRTLHPHVFDESPLPILTQWCSTPHRGSVGGRSVPLCDPNGRSPPVPASLPSLDAEWSYGEAAMLRDTGDEQEDEIMEWKRLSALFPRARVVAQPEAVQPTSEDGFLYLPSVVAPEYQWFFASAAAVLRTPRDVRRVILTPTGANTAEGGVFVVRLFLDHAWRYVVVDDYVPIDVRGRMLYAQPASSPGDTATETVQCVWPCVLLKAYAKLFGGYPALARRLPHCGITGGSTTHVTTGDVNRDVRKETASTPADSKEENQHRFASENAASLPLVWSESLAADTGDNLQRCCARVMSDLSGGLPLTRRLVQDSPSCEQWWSSLYSLLHTNPPSFAAAVAVGRTELPASARGASHLGQASGITPGAGYRVCQVRQLNGVRLVQLANPWATSRWRGDWSAGSPQWKEHLDVSAALQAPEECGGETFSSSRLVVPVVRDGASTVATRHSRGASTVVYNRAAVALAVGSNVSCSTVMLPQYMLNPSAEAEPFWMSYNDFLVHFVEVHVCRCLPEFHEVLIRGEWSEAANNIGGPPSSPFWHTNPHYQLRLCEAGRLIVQLSLPDPRLSSPPLAFSETATVAEVPGLHLLQGDKYPLSVGNRVGASAAGGTAPHILHVEAVGSPVLGSTPYVKTDHVTLEGELPCGEDYWLVPSTLSASAQGRFTLRVFCDTPLTVQQVTLTEHWYVEKTEEVILSSGAYAEGEDNGQLIVELAKAAPVPPPRFLRTPKTKTIPVLTSAIGGSSQDSTQGSTVANEPGKMLVRVIVRDLPESSAKEEGKLLPTLTETELSLQQRAVIGGTVTVYGLAGRPSVTSLTSSLSTKLFVTPAEHAASGAYERVSGPLPPSLVLAQSSFEQHHTVYTAVTTQPGSSYNVLCCVQPSRSRALLHYTICSSLPIANVAVLPQWGRQSVEVAWCPTGLEDTHLDVSEGDRFAVTGKPQVEVYPVFANEPLTVRVQRIGTTNVNQGFRIACTVFNNSGRCGAYLVDPLPSERVIVQSDFVLDDWVQTTVELADSVDSLLILPQLLPKGTAGRCLVTVFSASKTIRVRTLAGEVN